MQILWVWLRQCCVMCQTTPAYQSGFLVCLSFLCAGTVGVAKTVLCDVPNNTSLWFLVCLSFLCAGTVGVAKTVLYEVSENTNQAFHMCHFCVQALWVWLKQFCMKCWTIPIGLSICLSFLCAGTVGVAKTVLYEVSDNTNQAFHMSVTSVCRHCGCG